MPPTHHKSVILTHIFNTFPYGFSFNMALTTPVSDVWVCANAGICFKKIYIYISVDLQAHSISFNLHRVMWRISMLKISDKI